MQNKIIDRIDKAQEKKRPLVQPGDRVTVYVRLKEGDKERIQPFKGTVITRSPKSGRGPNATFTVRKVSEGIGVERVFPVHSPIVDRITVESSSEVRRSRLYYLRKLSGRKARLKEKQAFGDLILPDEPVQAPEEEVLEADAAETTEEVKAEAPAEQASEPEKKEDK